MEKAEIEIVDLSNPKHAESIVFIVDQYARDPMGLNRALSDEVKTTLIEKLKTVPTYIGFIAFIDGKPVGAANCFYSFSSFNAAKVINIHDLVVNPSFRGRGIGESLMAAVEKRAKEEKCYKITLEVREDNRAKNLYERFGFEYGEPKMLFMGKKIN